MAMPELSPFRRGLRSWAIILFLIILLNIWVDRGKPGWLMIDGVIALFLLAALTKTWRDARK
jgi:hypothetical protein